MFSAIAAFFWGASTAATPSPDPSPAPAPTPAPGHEEILPAGVNSNKDDVFSDAIAHEGVDDVVPAPVESILSTSSLSDEEAGWVFVNNKKRGNMTSIERETYPKGENPSSMTSIERETYPKGENPSSMTSIERETKGHTYPINLSSMTSIKKEKMRHSYPINPSSMTSIEREIIEFSYSMDPNPSFIEELLKRAKRMNSMPLTKFSIGSISPDKREVSQPMDIDPFLKREDMRSPPIRNNRNHNNNNNKNNNNVPATRSKNIPNSVLHASGVLDAIEELRPQQKSQRRQRERHLKRKQLERANKTAQVESSSNQPSKRRAMYNSAVFSRAVNNRKC